MFSLVSQDSTSRSPSHHILYSAWLGLRQEAARTATQDSFVRPLIERVVLKPADLAGVLAAALTQRSVDEAYPPEALRKLFLEAYTDDPCLLESAVCDLQAVTSRDPAATGMLLPLLFFKGFHALQTHRVAHWLWREHRFASALFLQSRSSALYGVDIHPAARIGSGVMIDHATGVVVGETAVVEDDVSLLHGVTLGGTGKEQGDRHPKIRRGVMIGAGAKVLGNIEVGKGACVAAGSVVLAPVPPHTTVAGVPARVVGKPRHAKPATEMDQTLADIWR